MLQHWELPELDKMLNNREMLACHPVKIQQLRSMLRFVSTTLKSNPDLLKIIPELQNIIQYEIPYLLAQTLMDSENPPIKSAAKKRTHALQTAVEYIKTPQGFHSSAENPGSGALAKRRFLVRDSRRADCFVVV